MGTLGRYLHDARVARGIDLREAAQQTRISSQYLRALEEENFKKLPGDVFVRGFLKNYARFLRLDEAEAMRLYAEMVQKPLPVGVANQVKAPAVTEKPRRWSSKIPIELFIWGAGIVIILILFLLTALPARHHKESRQASETPTASSPELSSALSSSQTPSTPEKLYLEVFALDNTWLLVRTDSSPQKKAVLKKGREPYLERGSAFSAELRQHRSC